MTSPEAAPGPRSFHFTLPEKPKPAPRRKRRWGLWLGLAAAALVLLPILLAALALAFFDPNAYRGEIAELLGRILERRIVIESGVRLSYYPGLVLELGPVTVSGTARAGASREPEATPLRIAGARIRFQLRPLLLDRELAPVEVVVQGPQIGLSPGGEGYEELKALLATLSVGRGPEPRARFRGFGLRLEHMRLTVKDGAARWRNEAAGLEFTAESLDLDLSPGPDYPFSLAFRLREEGSGLAAQTRLEGRWRDPRSGELALEDVALSAHIEGLLDRRPLAGDFKARLELAPDAANGPEARFKEASFASGFFGGRGSFSASGLDAATWKLRGECAVDRLSLKEIFPDLARMPDLASAEQGAPQQGAPLEAAFTLDRERLSLANLTLRLPQGPLKGWAEFAGKDLSGIRMGLSGQSLDMDRLFSEDGPNPSLLAKDLLAAWGGRTLEVDMNLARLHARGGQAGSVLLKIRAERKGKGAAASVTAAATLEAGDFFGGTLRGAYRSGATGLGLEAHFKDVAAEPLSALLLGQAWAKGSLTLDITATAQGATPREQAASFKGEAKGVFANGALRVKRAGAASAKTAAPQAAKGKPAAETAGEWMEFSRLAVNLEAKGALAPQSPAKAGAANKPDKPDQKGKSQPTQTARPAPAGKPVDSTDAAPKPFDVKLEAQLLGPESKAGGKGAAKSSGALSLQGRVTADIERLDLRGLRDAKAKIEYSALPEGFLPVGPWNPPLGQKAALKLSGEGNLEQGRFSLKQCDFVGPDLSFEAQVEIDKLYETPTYSGKFYAQEFNPKALLKRLGLSQWVAPGPSALGAGSARADFQADALSLRLTEARLYLDARTLLTGRVEWSKPKEGGLPHVQFHLTADALDADAYLPEAASGEQGGELKVWDLTPLQRLRLHGRLLVKKLKLFGLSYQDAHAEIAAENGKIALHPLAAKFYSGWLDASLLAEVGETLTLNTSVQAKDFQLDPVMRDLGAGESLGGVVNLNLNLNSQGRTPDSHLRSLGGKAAAIIQDGWCMYSRSNVTPGDGKDKTGRGEISFSAASGSFTIKDGVARNEDFHMRGLLLSAHGWGVMDLPLGKADYTLQGEFAGVPTIPLPIRGALSNPSAELKGDGAISETVHRLGRTIFGFFSKLFNLPLRGLDAFCPPGGKPGA